MYQYKHEYFTTWSIEEKFNGRYMEKVVSEYDGQGLEDYLNGMSSVGWELISMEAKWYNKVFPTHGHALSAPHEIMGWYLTFKRLAEVHED